MAKERETRLLQRRARGGYEVFISILPDEISHTVGTQRKQPVSQCNFARVIRAHVCHESAEGMRRQALRSNHCKNSTSSRQHHSSHVQIRFLNRRFAYIARRHVPGSNYSQIREEPYPFPVFIACDYLNYRIISVSRMYLMDRLAVKRGSKSFHEAVCLHLSSCGGKIPASNARRSSPIFGIQSSTQKPILLIDPIR